MITYESARELFDYRNDGYLVWKVCKANNIKIGDIAGSINSRGYRQIGIDRGVYMTHRLIWLWHHGYMPEGGLDHINRDISDNRIKNLREVSKQCNMRNTGNYKNNSSGVKGIIGYGIYQARVKVNGKFRFLGNFKDFDEAVLHRLAAEQCLNWDGCDSSSPAYQHAVENNLINERGCNHEI